jgi:hypothetical protein
VTLPGKPGPDGGARFMRRLLEDDPAHLDVASDEEIERQMEAAAVHVTSVPTLEELVARVEMRAAAFAPAVPRPSMAPLPATRRVRRWSPVPIAAAAALAAVGVAALMNRAVIVAHLRGEPIGPDQAWPPPSALPTPQDRASALRGLAFAACAKASWDECAQKLDQAAAIEPSGERAPRVISARWEIAEGKRDRDLGEKEMRDSETRAKPP